MSSHELIRRILRALPADALEARLALSLLAMRLQVDTSEFKGVPNGAPTVVRHHAKETQ